MKKIATSKNLKTDGIYVYGAREHNLKSLNVFIPRNKLTVVTGLSGSGKSSLVFDTIYAEGQRRYVESLSSYARFFISQIKKPDVDSIKGLSPAVAIDQRSINISPRSTVGTVSQTYDYLRLLFTKLGTPYCVEHQKPLQKTNFNQIIKEVNKWPKGTRFLVLSPVVEGKKGEFVKAFEGWISQGWTQGCVDGEWIELAKHHTKRLSKKKEHFIDILVDRLKVDPQFQNRLKESLQKAATLAEGRIKIAITNSTHFAKDIGKKNSPISKKKAEAEKTKIYCLHATCPVCLKGFPKVDPKLFSFNNPKGACPSCHGLGYIPDTWKDTTEYMEQPLDSDPLFYEQKQSNTEEADHRKKAVNTEEIEPNTEEADHSKKAQKQTCPACQGLRLQPFSLSVKIQNKNIAELSSLSVTALYDFCQNIPFPPQDKIVAEKVLEQIQRNLSYLKKIGLGYLSLSRHIKSLSGGEAQRVRLMSQISSPLVGALYVLDEPSIGLHPQDHDKLLEILFHIRDRGNTVLMVEHDEKSIKSADHIIDLGPLAGQKGGQVIAKGFLKDITSSSRSRTGWYLSGKKKISWPSVRTKGLGKWLEIKGACGHNLKAKNVKIPIGSLVAVTGVSGSGKSSLIMDTLYRAFLKKRGNETVDPLPYKEIKGLDFLDKVVAVNQKPIGRTNRSVPATYVGLLSPIRALMALTPVARMRGYTSGDFSFNIRGGRCENCLGTGVIKQEMVLLPTAILPCDVCHGRRYSEEILNVFYKGKNIYDILNMDVSVARRFFANHFLIERELDLLEQVGLGYLTLGQSAVTLSGGEAQRIKLTRELARKSARRTLYILDEPTTGLHFQDVENLLLVLKKLRDKGGTVILIEHHIDMIKSSDYIIDLGPGGGVQGGEVVVEGTPEQVARSKKSKTAPFLRSALECA